jgi:hypothetical protein
MEQLHRKGQITDAQLQYEQLLEEQEAHARQIRDFQQQVRELNQQVESLRRALEAERRSKGTPRPSSKATPQGKRESSFDPFGVPPSRSVDELFEPGAVRGSKVVERYGEQDYQHSSQPHHGADDVGESDSDIAGDRCLTAVVTLFPSPTLFRSPLSFRRVDPSTRFSSLGPFSAHSGSTIVRLPACC